MRLLALLPILGFLLAPTAAAAQFVVLPDTCRLTAGVRWGGANWVLAPSACIGPGDTLAGFEFQIEAGPCCYFLSAYGPTDNYIGGYEECFCLEVVQVESATWGRLKAIHR